MTILKLKDNPDYAGLPQIDSGDYVLLEKQDWPQYIIEALVTNTSSENDSHVCKITKVMDKQTRTPLTGGDVLDLVGKNVVVERRQIQQKGEQF